MKITATMPVGGGEQGRKLQADDVKEQLYADIIHEFG